MKQDDDALKEPNKREETRKKSSEHLLITTFMNTPHATKEKTKATKKIRGSKYNNKLLVINQIPVQ